jgi:LysM repeat protein
VLLLVRPLIILLVAMLLMVACTRERPTPEPTATTAIQVSAPATAAVEAQVITDTSASGTEADLAATNTPNALTPQPNDTPDPATPETFPYTVQEGDTLGSIAIQFETDIETLRELNTLESDSLGVGQLIYVPYQEGLQGPGLPTATPGPYYYTVQPGDTLSGLAIQFGVDPIAILEANAASLLDPNNLAVGTTILIPDYTPPADETTTETGGDEATEDSGDEDSGEPVVHVVTAGQGLLEIAALYGVAVAEITAANGMTDQDILRVGQELIIPGVTARDVAVTQGNVHVVQPGESLLSIALIYGVTVEELQEANELDNPDSIFIGQELIIPSQ